jgi:hypothetical protein
MIDTTFVLKNLKKEHDFNNDDEHAHDPKNTTDRFQTNFPLILNIPKLIVPLVDEIGVRDGQRLAVLAQTHILKYVLQEDGLLYVFFFETEKALKLHLLVF